MKNFNTLTYKEITIRYGVLTILLSTTIFMDKYNLPIWAYSICMGIAITGVGLNLVKWLREEKRSASFKGEVTRNGAISFMAILLLVIPLSYAVAIKLILILPLLIANVIEGMKLKKKHHLS